MKDYSSIDSDEVTKFSKTAATWWDPRGPYGALHQMNPIRIGFIRDECVRHFKREAQQLAPLGGLNVLDIGCGGGLLCEPLARLGAEVTGIDPSVDGIEIAKAHMAESNLSIIYQTRSAEELLQTPTRFDIVMAMEVVEHVIDQADFLQTACRLIAPGGLMFAATINRTFKSFALAIVGAEYLLRWVARGTHSWSKFVTPEEMSAALAPAGFQITSQSGIIFNPFGHGWQCAADMDVNYMICAKAGQH